MDAFQVKERFRDRAADQRAVERTGDRLRRPVLDRPARGGDQRGDLGRGLGTVLGPAAGLPDVDEPDRTHRQADGAFEGGGHRSAVPGHMAHLARGQPQLEGQRGQQGGGESGGDGGTFHGAQV